MRTFLLKIKQDMKDCNLICGFLLTGVSIFGFWLLKIRSNSFGALVDDLFMTRHGLILVVCVIMAFLFRSNKVDGI